jgi:hypothetical protein
MIGQQHQIADADRMESTVQVAAPLPDVVMIMALGIRHDGRAMQFDQAMGD